MFGQLTLAPPDPILGLTEAYKKDPNPRKINLGAGVYMDEKGRTPIFSCVKKAEQILVSTEGSKSYLPIDGSPIYDLQVQELLFGEASPLLATKRVRTAHTPGGTGALRVAADFLKGVRPGAQVWMSDPTWANHDGIFASAGFTIKKYAYYDAARRALDIEGMLASLGELKPGDVAVLHGCCHNPTGVDPTPAQWTQIRDAVLAREALPLIDFAYQGLKDGIAEDAAAVRAFAETCEEFLVANSFSKNFGLYAERVGGLTLVAADADAAEKAHSHIKIAVRRNYSNPPSHGGEIVRVILADAALRQEWEGELAQARGRINGIRRQFVDALQAKGVDRDFGFIAKQSGMFSFSGLSRDQVLTLRDKHSIYMVESGRMNIAGINQDNLDRLCDAIAETLAAA